MPSTIMEESSRLAATTRAARAKCEAYDRCGHPVLTIDRERALADLERAKAAEDAFWSRVMSAAVAPQSTPIL